MPCWRGKYILLVDPSEDRLAERRYILRVHGFDVIDAVRTPKCKAEALVHLVIAAAELSKGDQLRAKAWAGAAHRPHSVIWTEPTTTPAELLAQIGERGAMRTKSNHEMRTKKRYRGGF